MLVFPQMNKRKPTPYWKYGRRKHCHWQVTIFYGDGEKFSRTYTDHDKAVKFAARQKKSPVVKRTRVNQVSERSKIPVTPRTEAG
jgi:hypothetical protein